MSSSYIYENFPSSLRKPIRLLRLLPEDGHLRGEIEVHELSAAPQYEALSYVCGSDERIDQLETSHGAIHLTKNLRDALTRVRKKTSYNLLWADAISINQANTAEKAQQIGFMRDIFLSASRVLVDLGSFDTDDSKQIAELAKTAGPAFVEIFPMLSVMESRLTDLGVPGKAHPGWSRHQDLVFHPWFRRAWILQEFVVAQNMTMLLGPESIDWSGIFGIVHFGAVFFGDAVSEDIRKANNRITSAINRISIMAVQRLFFRSKELFRLSTFLQQLWYVDATLMQDKFFAILGIAQDGEVTPLLPDYDSSLSTVLQTYGHYFLWTEGLSALSFAGICEADPTLPSWAPCLSPSGPREDDGLQRRGVASVVSRQDIHFSNDGKDLLVTGTLLTRITHIDMVAAEPLWLARYLGGMVRIALPKHMPKQFALEIFAKLLSTSFGKMLQLLPQQTYGQLAEDSHAFVDEVMELFPTRGLDFTPEDKAEAYRRSDAYVNSVQMVYTPLNPCFTHNGLPGIVPAEAKEGDVIADFVGDNGLYILRPSARRGTYRLVGECYIPDIADMTRPGCPDEICIW